MGVVRGEALRETPVPVLGRPVHIGLQVLYHRPTCVRGGCSHSKVTLLVINSPICFFLEYRIIMYFKFIFILHILLYERHFNV